MLPGPVPQSRDGTGRYEFNFKGNVKNARLKKQALATKSNSKSKAPS